MSIKNRQKITVDFEDSENSENFDISDILT